MREPDRPRHVVVSPCGPETPTYTVPTGFPSCSSGPATPVVEIPYVAPDRSRAPAAIAAAHSAETTPTVSITETGTPSRVCFSSVAYVTKPRETSSRRQEGR